MNKDQIVIIGRNGITGREAGEALTEIGRTMSMDEINKALKRYRSKNNGNMLRIGNYYKALETNKVFVHTSKFHK
jgi:hypothetical protein